MSNNYFNYRIPDFCLKYGTDWDDFASVMEDNADYLFKKIEQLYWLNDIDRTPLQALNYLLTAYGLTVDYSDTASEKRIDLRTNAINYTDKSSEDFYLDGIEAIVGSRGTIYFGEDLGTFIDGVSHWPEDSSPEDTDWIWGTDTSRFDIHIDCDTTTESVLDDIEEWLKLPYIYPAFYQIYLVDSSLAILRTVTYV